MTSTQLADITTALNDLKAATDYLKKIVTNEYEWIPDKEARKILREVKRMNIKVNNL